MDGGTRRIGGRGDTIEGPEGGPGSGRLWGAIGGSGVGSPILAGSVGGVIPTGKRRGGRSGAARIRPEGGELLHAFRLAEDDRGLPLRPQPPEPVLVGAVAVTPSTYPCSLPGSRARSSASVRRPPTLSPGPRCAPGAKGPSSAARRRCARLAPSGRNTKRDCRPGARRGAGTVEALEIRSPTSD